MGKPLEVAAYLQVEEPTLRNWRYLGRGPKWVKVGGRVRYRWTDVEAYVQQSTAAA